MVKSGEKTKWADFWVNIFLRFPPVYNVGRPGQPHSGLSFHKQTQNIAKCNQLQVLEKICFREKDKRVFGAKMTITIPSFTSEHFESTRMYRTITNKLCVQQEFVQPYPSQTHLKCRISSF